MQCTWLKNKECPYLELKETTSTTILAPDGSIQNKKFINKKSDLMLENFTVKEICNNCFMSFRLQMRR